jgi:nitrite reductase/ring-hydroxylating ferredoxin subunit
VSSWHPVAKVGDIKPGDVIAVEVEGVQMVLGLDGERYFATQRHCVHRGGDLSDGIVSRGHVVCANHGWRFSTATGRHDSASDVCLVVYAVRVNGEQIEIDPVPRTLRGF